MKYQERIFWIAVVVVLFLFLRSCGGILGIVKTHKPKPDTISIKQVVREIQVKKDTQYIPELVGVTNTIHVPTYIHDTLETFETKILPTDTAAILSRYYQTASYSDTQQIKPYGNVIIQDKVTQNRIASRHLITNLTIPEKTTTITIRDKRTIGYLDIYGNGTKESPLYSVGVGASLKFKNDYVFGVLVNIPKQGGLIYGIRTSLPIRLKK